MQTGGKDVYFLFFHACDPVCYSDGCKMETYEKICRVTCDTAGIPFHQMANLFEQIQVAEVGNSYRRKEN